jgi:hypothetical protein
MAKLTDRSLEALRPRTTRYYHFDGKPRRLTFGTYPRLTLADAGVKLAEAKQLLDKGHDPGAQVVAERIAERRAETVADLVARHDPAEFVNLRDKRCDGNTIRRR